MSHIVIPFDGHKLLGYWWALWKQIDMVKDFFIDRIICMQKYKQYDTFAIWNMSYCIYKTVHNRNSLQLILYQN